MPERSLQDLKELFEIRLKDWLHRPLKEEDFYSKRLEDSLIYGLNSPGKRLRPLVVLTSALSFKKDLSKSQAINLAMPAALAVELLHTYSLIHDDLPAMDNDDFRRGRLSMHRRFDEALAILAGDALLTDAFSLAASCKNNPQKVVLALAKIAGSRGLVAGQAEDLAYGAKDWLKINEAKTAKLFEASALMGALAVGASSSEQALAKRQGHHFGMAFQLKDDLEDGQGLALLVDAADLSEVKDAHLECIKEIGANQIIDLVKATFS